MKGWFEEKPESRRLLLRRRVQIRASESLERLRDRCFKSTTVANAGTTARGIYDPPMEKKNVSLIDVVHYARRR